MITPSKVAKLVFTSAALMSARIWYLHHLPETISHSLHGISIKTIDYICMEYHFILGRVYYLTPSCTGFLFKWKQAILHVDC